MLLVASAIREKWLQHATRGLKKGHAAEGDREDAAAVGVGGYELAAPPTTAACASTLSGGPLSH